MDQYWNSDSLLYADDFPNLQAPTRIRANYRNNNLTAFLTWIKAVGASPHLIGSKLYVSLRVQYIHRDTHSSVSGTTRTLHSNGRHRCPYLPMLTLCLLRPSQYNRNSILKFLLSTQWSVTCKFLPLWSESYVRSPPNKITNEDATSQWRKFSK